MTFLRLLWITALLSALVLALCSLLVALAGCPGKAIYSTAIPGLYLEREYHLNTSQPCLDEPEALRCAEQMADGLLADAAQLGYASSKERALSQWGHPGLCVVARWEACRLGDYCAAASTEALRCSPRAGCTIENSSWISRSDEHGARYDYTDTLETELRVSIGNRLSIPVNAKHNTEWESRRTGVRCRITTTAGGS